MAHSLLFFDPEKGSVELRVYDEDGRLVDEEKLEARQLELKVPMRIHVGAGVLVLFSIEGSVSVRGAGGRLIVEPGG